MSLKGRVRRGWRPGLLLFEVSRYNLTHESTPYRRRKNSNEIQNQDHGWIETGGLLPPFEEAGPAREAEAVLCGNTARLRASDPLAVCHVPIAMPRQYCAGYRVAFIAPA